MGVRNHVRMSATRPHTKDYSQTDRDRLGVAVQRAREAVSAYRPKFAALAGIGVTSLVKLETGKPVGPYVYETVSRALPSWTEDTPVVILKGGEAPQIPARPTVAPEANDPMPSQVPARVEFSAKLREQWRRMSVDEIIERGTEIEASIPELAAGRRARIRYLRAALQEKEDQLSGEDIPQ